MAKTPSDITKTQSSLEKINRLTPQQFDIRIAADGTWFHEGGLIGRQGLVRLFASVLQRYEDGTFWLVTPVERGQITVEDAPFIGIALAVTGQGIDRELKLTTNVGDIVRIDNDHKLRMQTAEDGDARPYVTIRDRLDAKLSRPVYYELAALAESDDDGRLGVWSAGSFFPLMD
ncbi:DUF1285 domain-containing protein [Candidatus Puniceispirillum sp.]|jgi:uncharacterized protein|uniref:DUF1285 domain-containing protein n=1 Tax=Candidatus Puniceispirillum sp. TaxID=2026719 RepID=UPI001EC63068|nr:DUF1285 domain-containing protein [Candidatus Puniceispirillum sp.]MBT6567232.1 DUF1285 domain-containing protein [Candidatus Puniceispirillum sp.]